MFIQRSSYIFQSQLATIGLLHIMWKKVKVILYNFIILILPEFYETSADYQVIRRFVSSEHIDTIK